ncbi:MAG TPA: hypothetical protein GXX20_08445 [Clostridiaceae bacterium]|nr:hypothetical protein [Clostridiaceae bacterium]
MKFKNPKYIIFIIVASVVMIAVVMYISGVFNLKSENSSANKNSDQTNVLAETENKNDTDDITSGDDKEAEVTGNKDLDENKHEEGTGDSEEVNLETEEAFAEENWIVESPVKIIDNSPEFEVEMALCYDNENKAFVILDYYYDGVSRSREYSSGNIPFLKQVEDTDDYIQSAGYTIQEATLNGKLAKLYFFVKKKNNSSNELFCLYVIDLKNGDVKEIYIGEGTELSPLKFSKDKKMAAFCYTSNKGGPVPDSMLQILDCSSDRWYIVEGKTPLGNRIGQEGVPDKHYSYKMLSWKSDTEISLMEISYMKADQDSAGITPEEIEVIYDVSANLIKYPEGYDSRGVKIVVEKEPEEPQDSPPMMALKNFYKLINNEEYNKAYDLLDEKFRLNAFKMFGSFEISKNEIDVEYFSEIAAATGIFKSLQIKEIKKEETEGSVSKIYYIQSVNLEDGSNPLELSLVATLSMVGEEWKITALDDWTEPANTQPNN